jgi:regulator of sigma E protease
MTIIITILSFLAVLAVIIIAHELGHFATAKMFGVKVDEFGIGFPPRLLSFKRGETIYSLNAVPLGGFTKMAGEEDPKISRSLASKGTGPRLLIIAAGSLMNAFLPVLLFSIAFMIPHDIATGQVVVEEVTANSPAASAGLVLGDNILSMDGRQVNNIGDLHRYTQLNLGNKVSLEVQHEDKTTETVELVPRWRPPEGEGAMGVRIRLDNPTLVSRQYPFWKAIPMGVLECIETFVLFKNGVISMIIGSIPTTVAGPVGIAQITGEVAQTGISPLLEFAAFLSINLALINLFPLPALDGGRIVFVLLEWIRRGRRISPKTEGMIHTMGFILLITTILLVTYQDILRIISGDSLLP